MNRLANVKTIVATLSATLLAGCGNLTVGGFGEASVVVSADAPDPNPASPQGMSALAPMGLALSDHDDDDPEGELQVEFLLFLVGADGTEVSLSDDELEVQADLQGQLEVDAVEGVVVPAQRYTDFKIVFLKIQAEVSAGLVVNGEPITGEIRVELGDIELPITRPIDLEISDGERVELLVDMNATNWLSAVDPNLLVVAEQIFENAITVEVR